MKKLLEIKARYDDLNIARKILSKINAEKIGVYHQIDTYFNVDIGRLKLREVEGEKSAKLVYYIREDIRKPKQSNVYLAEICDIEGVREILTKIFGMKVVVDKIREIYRYNGIQIHLDKVKKLGRFIEFEVEIKDLKRDKERILELMKILKIDGKDLIRGSYSDLLSFRQ